MKIGLIGLGRVGKIHLSNLIYHFPEAEVIIASDVMEESHGFAKKLGVARVTSKAEDVLTHPEVEAVIICAPTPFHVPYVKLAAQNGKHIFCEKPIDVSVEAIMEAQQEVARYGVKLMVGFNRRFDDNFAHIREHVEAGKIGAPHILRITSRDPAPPSLEYLAGSGGIFLDMTIHDFDMARFIVGSEVTEVYVKGDALVNPAIKELGDMDTAVIVLSFENGAIGVIDNSRKAVYGYDQRLEIFGSGGMVKTENRTPDNLSYFNESGVVHSLPLYFFLERYEKAFKSCLKAFLDSIATNSPTPVDLHDGLMATALGIAAMRSCREGRPVKLSEVLPRVPVY